MKNTRPPFFYSFAGGEKIMVRAIAAAIAVAAMPTYAEKALEEVIVTAQKKDETLQTVPMTVNAVTEETLKKYNLLDFKDIASVAPGVTLQGTNTGGATVAMRGVNVLTVAGYGPGVAVYWNEIDYNIDSAYKAMYDIAQVEVLRGPQGTLRGITAPAGAITINTKGPSFSEIEGTVEQTLGERNLSNTQFGLSLPIIEDKLALRIAGLYDHNQNDDIKDVITGKTTAQLSKSGRVTLGFRPFDGFEGALTYQYMDVNSSGPAFSVRGCGIGAYNTQTACYGTFDRKAVNPGPVANTDRRQATVLHLDWDLGPATFTSVTGYQDTYTNGYPSDQDVGYALPAGTNQFSGTNINLYQFTQELRLASNDNDFYNWTYGLYGSKITSHVPVVNGGLVGIYAGLDRPSFFGVTPQNIFIDQTNEGYAGFTNQSFQFTDKLNVQVGARYQTLRRTQFLSLAIPSIGLGPLNLVDRVSNGHAWTGSGSVSYQLTDDVLTYLTLGRSYRPGGFTIAPTTDPEFQKYKPEYSDSLEIGVKTRFADGRVQLNADVYVQKYTDYLARTYDFIRSTSSFGGVANDQLNYNADAKVQGVELQLDALLTDDWTAGAGISYNDSKFTGGEAYCNVRDANGVVVTPSGPAPAINTCPAHGRVAGEPNWNANATSEYTMHFGAVDSYVRGLYTFSSGRADDSVANSVNDTSSYGVFNLFVGVRDPKKAWDVSIWAKNLFDKQAVLAYYSEETRGFTPFNFLGGPFNPTADFSDIRSGYSQVQLIPERQIGITGKYNFSL